MKKAWIHKDTSVMVVLPQLVLYMVSYQFWKASILFAHSLLAFQVLTDFSAIIFLFSIHLSPVLCFMNFQIKVNLVFTFFH